MGGDEISARDPGSLRTMDDVEVVEGFLNRGERSGGSARLQIEEDALVLDGWWPLAFRVTKDVFGLRDDQEPDPVPDGVDLAGTLARSGLVKVAENPSLLHTITYSEIALGLVAWSVWARDLDTANLALQARAEAATSLTRNPNDLPF